MHFGKKTFNKKHPFIPMAIGRKLPSPCGMLMYILVFLSLVFSCVSVKGQSTFEKIDGLPTKEIYDLHVDKKGYLWIAHGLGVSRYDGLNFIQFTNPDITSLRMTDLLEDKQGRIWCHNFSGQIFYIEHGTLNLLSAYDYKKETQSPSMALCGDELVVTSRQGLFVWSTKTMKESYFKTEQLTSPALTSLSVTGNRVVIFNTANWFLYQRGKGIQKLAADSSIEIAKGNTVSLQTASSHDTIYLVTNPAGTLQRLVLENDMVKRVDKIEYHDYINSVIADGNVWVNTRNKSIAIGSNEVIRNYNLTDIVTGKEGNIWYSSINKGLMVSFQPSKWKKITFPIDGEDFVRSLNVNDDYFFAGTQKGYLVLMKRDTGKPLWKHNMFNGFGSIDFIRFFKDHRYIVGTSTNSYIIDPIQKKIEEDLPVKSITDLDFDKNNLYLATPNGFYLLPLPDSSTSSPDWQVASQGQLPFFHHDNTMGEPYLLSAQRSQAICFDSEERTVYVSTKNGLQQVTKNGVHPFYINGQEVYTSSLAYEKPRLYIATINDGLWIKGKNSLTHFATNNYLYSNTILKIKAINDHLWLLENNGIQVINLINNAIINDIDLPKITGSDVFDITEKMDMSILQLRPASIKCLCTPPPKNQRQ